MTINKSQGQTLKNGFFYSASFGHGELYAAASVVRSLDGLRLYIFEYDGQGHLANDERVCIKKIRLQRSFKSLIKLSKYVCHSSLDRFFFNRMGFCFNKKYMKKCSLLQ